MDKFVLIPLTLWQSLDKQREIPIEVGKKEVPLPIKKEIEHPHDRSLDYPQDQTEQIYSKLSTNNSKEIFSLILSNNRLTLSQSNTILLDDSDTNVPIVEFIKTITNPKKVAGKYRDIPGSYHSILEVLNLEKNRTKNRNAVKKVTGGWSSFSF